MTQLVDTTGKKCFFFGCELKGTATQGSQVEEI
jgi:hypothetical protein